MPVAKKIFMITIMIVDIPGRPEIFSAAVHDLGIKIGRTLWERGCL